MKPSRRRFDLSYALLLAMGYLAACLWWDLRDILHALLSEQITTDLIRGEVVAPVLVARLAGFAAALLALHLFLGLAAWACARLTAAALPRIAARRQRLLVMAWFALLALLVMLGNADYFPASQFTPPGGWMVTDWHGLRPVGLVAGAIALLL